MFPPCISVHVGMVQGEKAGKPQIHWWCIYKSLSQPIIYSLSPIPTFPLICAQSENWLRVHAHKRTHWSGWTLSTSSAQCTIMGSHREDFLQGLQQTGASTDAGKYWLQEGWCFENASLAEMPTCSPSPPPLPTHTGMHGGNRLHWKTVQYSQIFSEPIEHPEHMINVISVTHHNLNNWTGFPRSWTQLFPSPATYNTLSRDVIDWACNLPIESMHCITQPWLLLLHIDHTKA